MKEEIKLFEGHQVEVIEFDGQVLFNANHVAEILDVKNVRDNISKMNEKQVIKLTNSIVGKTDIRKMHNNGENFLTESGVYKLVFKSHKPNAETFIDWISDEVLPTLRKTGTYTVNTSYQYPLSAATFEGVANLGRLIERVMKTEGAGPHEIAMVLKPIFQQAGLEVMDCFIKLPPYEQITLEVLMR